LDGQTYHVHKGERRLPQGAPSSPAITNILCWRLDRRFAGMAKSLGWTYTRYADDLTFSKAADDTRDVNRILWQARQIVENEGFILHPDKIKVMRRSNRQEVTGVVVNEKLNVPRAKLKQFRAVLHRLETQGAAAVNFGQGHVLESIKGFTHYVQMVNPEKGAALKAELDRILNNPIFKEKQPVANQADQKDKRKKITTPAQAKLESSEVGEWWRLW
jgi:retron-type reverse transcriptase